jgi:hypothetical protein
MMNLTLASLSTMPMENTPYCQDLANQQLDRLRPLEISHPIFHGMSVSKSQCSALTLGQQTLAG